ncbi:LOW QUALITY PROTEIN: 2'-5' RNA ligase [Brevundimonas abyssalis TAR-001]|uniref:RNA 2',3'-cyclic phosphodiesterase n=1 Tax=Brevundimonas abyssalis TAR-001 TaxID=1391729 RepID=A0A8E0NBR1_9CAUL|nr:LOW QUALITY PROTEIN: 2'-5' RNA ligase [Brevundimonas abyssalis TAR-001]
MIRLFAAVPIPFDIAEGLARRQRGLPGARWRPAEALHITLAFYGALGEPRADDLAAELTRPGSIRSIHSRASGPSATATGPAPCGPGWPLSEPLNILAGRCRVAGQRAGVVMESRDYRPHVTLAYLRGAEDDRVGAWMTGHNLLHSPPFRVDRFGLYTSVLTDAGSHYTLEREYLF